MISLVLWVCGVLHTRLRAQKTYRENFHCHPFNLHIKVHLFQKQLLRFFNYSLSQFNSGQAIKEILTGRTLSNLLPICGVPLG